MKIIFTVLTICFFWGCGNRFPDLKHGPQAQSRFLIAKGDLPKAAALGLALDGREGESFLAYTNATNIDDIRAALPSSVLQTEDVTAELNEHLRSRPNILSDLYTWERVLTDLRQWTNTHSDNVSMRQYGTSTGGRPLTALMVHSGPSLDDTKPTVMITGATHGNEILTVEVVMGIAHNLMDNLASERIQRMLGAVNIVFIPVVSPDSFVARQRYVDGVDPNRDYPWPESTNHISTPVIKAISAFATSLNLVSSIDYHSVASVIMWPWAYTNAPPAQAVKYERMARSMAETNHYRIGQISDVMYIAQGSSADYYLWKKGSMSFGIELSQSMPTSSTTVQDMVRENLESTYRFIEAAPPASLEQVGF
jgi:Zinc carboxypeptidase